MTCPSDDDLALAALGEFDHACDDCRATRDAFARTVAVVRDRFENHPSEDDLALAAIGELEPAHECPDCRKAIDAYAAAAAKVRDAFRPRRSRWGWLGGAAAAALLALALWPRVQPPPPEPAAPPVSMDGARIEIEEADLHIVWIFQE